ncbi:MAG: family 78 glycoside hydrolase catalytic domain [Imperialibacter sp.]|uniref:family 78 glycoside hydrolase catalytic domain n=1 Tax=Imperialibacter sp. TaxID=2038411 RepID=UPI0032EFF828
MRLLLLLSLAILASCTTNGNEPGKISPSNLTCEYLENPSVVDVAHPRLAWINTSIGNERGQKQTAWQVRVASSKAGLENPDLWDSKKVDSEQTDRVEYQGTTLASRTECWWQVRVWDKDGNPSGWSEPGQWRMGLLAESDWKAQWIGAPWQGEEALPKPDGGPDGRPKKFAGPAPMLRKEFEITKEIDKAVAYVTGLGYFEFYANGEKVGDDVLVPNQTNYGKRPGLNTSYINVQDDFRRYKVMYLAYDVKEHLKQGKNAIGSMLGNGFYNPAKFWTEGYGSPRFLGQVHITYKDGTEEVIVSDESWKASQSPILMDMVYYGEVYDARKEQPGWSTADFDQSSWEPVVKRKAPEGELVAHTAYPDKVTEKLEPVSIEKLDNGNYKVDFGVEISGWVRFNKIEGPEGHQIDISFNGNLYSGDNTYIFNGKGPTSYAPRFNWFVFSGIEIKNWPGELKKEHLTAEAVNTYVEESAVFETSNQLFNDINKIWRRSQTDNMHGGIASDCPHRERSGYTGDGQVACSMVMHNFDTKNFYYKWIQDMYEAQNVETGYVPNGAPWQPGCGGGVAWGAAICIMPWEFYTQYAALDMLEDNYDGMQGYIRYMQTWVDEDGIMFSQRRNGSGEILKWFNLGEWVSPGELIPDDMVHTFYFWRCVEIASKTARILGKKGEAEAYESLAQTTTQAFYKKFYNSETGSYGKGGGNVLALRMGVPAGQYDQVKAALIADIKADNGHLDTGIFGTRFFFEVLASNGLNNLAYEALNKTDEPSFGHWLELGSTTTREHWSEDGSFNHPMFGGGLVWLYKNLAGMQTDIADPGYKHIIFRPQPVDELDFVTYSNNTIYGQAGITWKNQPNDFQMNVTVPVGSTATVYIPASEKEAVTEGGEKAENSASVNFKGMEEGYAIFEVGSGNYNFVAKK